MKKFMDDNFILQTETAEYLYHEHAKKMPIIDYHSHLIPEQIAENKQFDNVTQPWLYGDHYKWRAMRTNGVEEKYCTGDASDWQKFEKWAETIPHTLRNPLFHWTHLELKAYFGVTDILSPKTAESIYEKASGMLQTENFRVQGLLEMMNVEVVCTTDDPIDSLEHHIAIAKSGAKTKVFPTWRPDKSMAVQNPKAYNEYLDKLSEVSGININSFSALLDAIKKRHDFFHKNGCRLADHGLEVFYAEKSTQSEIDAIFKKVRSGSEVTVEEDLKFKSAALYEFAILNHSKGWAQQFHYGALRNNNTRLLTKLGPDTGFDSIGDWNVAVNMSKFLNRLDLEDKLTKTIIYNLNPADNAMVATMIGNFQDGSVPGKIQWGSGWWFMDQKDGMENQMNALSNLGLLSRFVGMLTDSRSFLSYPRHEYFRRILCNLLGKDVENGELPNDRGLLGQMVEDISYNNAKNYFKF
ncbi:MAG: glucuronate isomerase [Bacteroidales bacterium]|nr:glucuronate isomerase [Bacteroidales bacterium]MBN2818670.1 glucuronate isomerase [Bacteroidales bacterium]